MDKGFTSLLLVLAVAAALTGAPSTAQIASGQQKKPSTKADQYPTFFKVYSKDGRESLTATCTPINLNPVVNQVTCKFINVRLIPPEEQPGTTDIPLSVEEAIKAAEEELKANPRLEQMNPRLAQEVQEVKKNPKKFEQELRKELEKVKQEFCSPSSEERVAIETKMRDPSAGPKRKSFYQQLIAACSDKDPTVFARRLSALERRTCDLWVEYFTLEFKKVREGQWLYQQETPGLLSKTLKVYELAADGLLWTLSETRVPTQGAEEKPIQTVWSWKNFQEYELPCEFISHSLIQVPFP